MRALVLLLAALLLWMLGVNSAAAQSPLDCAVVPQNICEDAEILALEGERSALVEQLTTLDPAHPALANEQIWLDGLGACGDDDACYRNAYLNHNQLLREGAAAPPTAPAAETPIEEPPDAASIEEAEPAPERAARKRVRGANRVSAAGTSMSPPIRSAGASSRRSGSACSSSMR